LQTEQAPELTCHVTSRLKYGIKREQFCTEQEGFLEKGPAFLADTVSGSGQCLITPFSPDHYGSLSRASMRDLLCLDALVDWPTLKVILDFIPIKG